MIGECFAPHRRMASVGDAEKARELYELAAVAGIEKARERLEALKSHSPPDAVSFGGRKAQHKESSQ